MIVSDEHRFVFIALPKNASRAVRNWAKGNYSAIQVGKYHGVCKGYRSYFVFTTKRNPFSRFVSRWNMLFREVNGGQPFSKRYFNNVLYPSFVKYVKKMPNKHDAWNPCASIPLPDYLAPQISCIQYAQEFFNKPIKIISKDNLEKELKLLPFVNEKKIQLTYPGTHDYGDWRDYYNKGWMTKKVKEFYRDDFNALDYSVYIT